MIPLLLIFSTSIDIALSLDKTVLTIAGTNELLLQAHVRESIRFSTIVEVVIDKGITGFSDYCFSGFAAMQKISFLSPISYIGSYCFEGCGSLLSLDIPNGVQSILSGTFINCVSLKSLGIPQSIATIETTNTFSNCGSFINFTVDPSNQFFRATNDHEYLISGTILVATHGRPKPIEVPSDITEIADYCASGKFNINGVIFKPNSQLKIVRSGAFRFTNITSLEFPYGTAELYSNIFDSTPIVSITLPGSLTMVDFNFLTGIETLQTISVTNSIGARKEKGVLYNQDNYILFVDLDVEELHIPLECEALSQSSLKSCKNLHNLTVAENHTVYAASGSVLYSSDFKTLFCCPNGVFGVNVHQDCEVVADRAFSSCNCNRIGFLGVYMKKIGFMSFARMKNLTYFQFPLTLESIDSNAFSGSTFEFDITFPLGLNSISDSFIEAGIIRADFRQCISLTIIFKETFSNCKNLRELYLPPYVQSIGISSFASCSSLSSVTIPGSVQNIFDYAFVGSGLSSLEFSQPSSLLYLGVDAFALTSIKRIEIPDTLQTISQGVFAGNEELTDLIFNDISQLAVIKANIIERCTKLESISFGQSLNTVAPGALCLCLSLLRIDVSQNNPKFTSIDGILYEKVGSSLSLVCCPGGLTSVRLNGSVISIADSAFYGCSLLGELSFADDVPLSKIGESTFYGCTSLLSIKIPSNVDTLSDSAFYGCFSLQEVIFEDDSLLKILGSGAFNGCSNLHSVIFNGNAKLEEISNGVFSGCKKLTKFSFPESLTSIGDNAFFQCESLKEVVITEKVVYIGSNSFNGCLSLQSVRVPKSVESIGANSFFNCPELSKITYCGDRDFTAVIAFDRVSNVASVQLDYRYPTFCGVKCMQILDSKCAFPTQKFTIDKDSSGVSCLMVSTLIVTEGE